MNSSYATRWDEDAPRGAYVFADQDICYVQMESDDPRWTLVDGAAGIPAEAPDRGLLPRSSWRTPDGTVLTIFARTVQHAVCITSGGARVTCALSDTAMWDLVQESIPEADWDAIRAAAAAERMAYDVDVRRHRQSRQHARWGSVSVAELGRRQTRGEDISGVMG